MKNQLRLVISEQQPNEQHQKQQKQKGVDANQKDSTSHIHFTPSTPQHINHNVYLLSPQTHELHSDQSHSPNRKSSMKSFGPLKTHVEASRNQKPSIKPIQSTSRLMTSPTSKTILNNSTTNKSSLTVGFIFPPKSPNMTKQVGIAALKEKLNNSSQSQSSQSSSSIYQQQQLLQQNLLGTSFKMSSSTNNMLGLPGIHTSYTKKIKKEIHKMKESQIGFLEKIIKLPTSLEEQAMEQKDGQFFLQIKQGIEDILIKLKLLEEEERVNSKELQKLQQLNSYLILSNKKREQIYEEAVKENIQVKQQLKVIQENLKRREEKLAKMSDKFETFGGTFNPDPQYKINRKNEQKNHIILEEDNHQSSAQKSNKQPTSGTNGGGSLSENQSARNIKNPSQQSLKKIENSPSSSTINEISNHKQYKEDETILNKKEIGKQQEKLGQSQQQSLEALKQEQNSSFEDNNIVIIPDSEELTSKVQAHLGIEEFQDDEYIRKMRFNFAQHSTDFYFFSLLLDLTMSKTLKLLSFQLHTFYIDDSQILQYYTGHKNVNFLKEQCENEDKFVTLLRSLNKEKFEQLFDSIRHSQQIADTAIKMVLKLKQIILTVANMNSKILVPDAFEGIVNETCKIIDCDRSSVFLVDNERNELWTKVAKGTSTIRVPMNKGLVGHVAVKGETLNILDAHKDYRFNRDIDKKTNYKTKTVLCVPIYDKSRTNVVGVLQAINKNSESFFSKDDEGLIHILATVAQQILRNSLLNDQNASFQTNLRSLLKIGLELNACRSFKTLIPLAESLFTKTFEVSEIRVYVHNSEQQNLFRYIEGQEQPSSYDLQIGLVGECFKTGQILSVSNAYTHNKYNSIIDINTSLPVITMPISIQDKNGIAAPLKLGIVTVTNQRGVEGISIRMNSQNKGESSGGVNNIKPSVGSTFEETVTAFGTIIAQVSSYIFELEKKEQQ